MQTPYFDLGYSGEGRLALYQPILDRFLIVINNPIIIEEVKLLASSRYTLFTCDLTQAKNYQPNLVDNICCHNWTLSNRHHIKIAEPYRNTCIAVESLEPAQDSDYDSTAEIEWLHFLRFFTEIIHATQNSLIWFRNQSFVNSFMQENFGCVFDDLVQSIQQMRREMYLSRDFNECQDRVLDIVQKNFYLNLTYQNQCLN